MLLLPLAAACMPAHDEALNERSLMPPVSVTMQPRNFAVVAAEPVELADALDEVLPAAGAELVLLPHAAMTSVADTASAAVAHALYFTLTSTGPARRSAWPRNSSWVDPQGMPGGLRWERDTRLSDLLVAESEPDHDGISSLPDRHPGFPAGVLVPSYKAAGPAS